MARLGSLRIVRRLCGRKATSESRMTRQSRAWLREMGDRRPVARVRPGSARRPVPGRRSIEYQQQYPHDEQPCPSVRGYGGNWSAGNLRVANSSDISSGRGNRAVAERFAVALPRALSWKPLRPRRRRSMATRLLRRRTRTPPLCDGRARRGDRHVPCVSWSQAVRRGPKMSNAEFGPARSGRSSPPCILKKQRRRP